MMIKAGDRMVGGGHRTGPLLALFAPTILPIALAYHTAHYLPSLLVDGQYVLVAMNDPFGSGATFSALPISTSPPASSTTARPCGSSG